MKQIIKENYQETKRFQLICFIQSATKNKGLTMPEIAAALKWNNSSVSPILSVLMRAIPNVMTVDKTKKIWTYRLADTYPAEKVYRMMGAYDSRHYRKRNERRKEQEALIPSPTQQKLPGFVEVQPGKYRVRGDVLIGTIMMTVDITAEIERG